MRIGGLFFGYGGLDLAVQTVLGAHLAWVADNDPAASAIIAHRFPGVPNLGDVTRIDWHRLEPVDILTGGTPCQDLSHAGRRKGMTAGTRSNLWAAMREAIAVLHPSLVVWENVRGAYSASADSDLGSHPGLLAGLRRRGGDPLLRALGRVLGDLASLGYDTEWCGLRAADAGAPHLRYRIFVAAFPEDQRHQWAGAPRGWWTGPADGGLHPVHLLPTPAVNDMGERKTPETWDAWTAEMQARHGNGNGHGPSLAIEAQRLLPTPTSADKKASGAAGYGGNDYCTLTDATARQPQHWGRYTDAITRWEHLTRPAPPATAPGPHGPRLSPAFSEWMMGLPDGWVTAVPGLTRNDQLRALGNGVVPQQATAALRHLLNPRTQEERDGLVQGR